MAHPDAFCARMRFYLNMRIGKGRKTASRFLVEFVLLCRAIARIGEVPQAEGFVRINVATLPNLQKSRFAADGQPLRLASSPLPLYRADAATQRKTLQRFRLLIMMHSYIA